MSAYRADIEIGVKGTRQLEQLRSLITQTTQAFDSLNRIASTRGGLVQNVSNYVNQLNRASLALDNVTMGSLAEAKAIREYVTVMGQANTARARQNYLIQQEIANRRQVQATVDAGFGQQGPALPPSMRTGTRQAGGGKGINRAISSAAIGGAFPLLFGQSGAAATGGAIGGIAGELFGPIGGFGGSLIGTLIGEKIGQGNKVKELAADIGFSAEQTKRLGVAFQQAGKDFDKFQESVSRIQGLSLSIEDQGRAIQLASALTEGYGGKIDKVTNAFTNALQTGKVTQGTLNQLTSQGIPIQEALANKYGVSRSAILQMAKDGKISVQTLIDVLVEVGNEGQASAYKQASSFDTAYKHIEDAVKRLQPVFEGLFKFISNQLSSTLDEVLNALTNIVTGMETMANIIGPIFEGLAAKISSSLAKVQIPPWLASFMREGATSMALNIMPGGAGLNFLRQVGKDTRQNATKGRYTTPDQQQAVRERLSSFSALGQMPPSKSGSSAADKAAKAAEREAARVANIVRDRAAETEILRMQMIFAEQITVAEINKDPVLKSQLQTTEKINQISLNYNKAINDEKAKGNSIAAKEAITKKALAEIEKTNFEGALDIAKIEIDRKQNYDNLLMDLDQELKLRFATTEEARNQLRIEYEMKKLKQGGEYTGVQLAEIEKRKQKIGAPKTDAQSITDRIGQLKDELKELTKVSTVVITAADAIGTSFSTSFKGIIDGSMTAREALASFFQSVADAFLDMAAQIIAKWITMTILNSVLSLFPGGGGGGGLGSSQFQPGSGPQLVPSLPGAKNYSGAFGKRASGGPVTGGNPYIVGEKGPELFVPGRSGTIVPNDAMGGGVQVGAINISVQNTGDNLSPAAQKQIAGQVQSIVMSTLVDQRRSGGVLTR